MSESVKSDEMNADRQAGKLTALLKQKFHLSDYKVLEKHFLLIFLKKYLDFKKSKILCATCSQILFWIVERKEQRHTVPNLCSKCFYDFYSRRCHSTKICKNLIF